MGEVSQKSEFFFQNFQTNEKDYMAFSIHGFTMI